MTGRPDRWQILQEALDNESLDRAPSRVSFVWGSGRSEEYSEQELREKIASENRPADDPFVQAYRELTGRDPVTPKQP